MNKETISSTPVNARSNRRIWLVVLIVALCLALFCCVLIVAAVLWLRPTQIKTYVPGLQIVPTSTSIPIVPSMPAEAGIIDISRILDVEAEPNSGFISLQRGFSPDPYSLGMLAFGDIDTSSTNLACGFVTQAPTYAFNLSGGASDVFLRVYFVPAEPMDTTLIVHTPDQGWLCGKITPNGSAAVPIVDIEFAGSGKYTVWLGVPNSADSVYGELNITQFAGNTP